MPSVAVAKGVRHKLLAVAIERAMCMLLAMATRVAHGYGMGILLFSHFDMDLFCFFGLLFCFYVVLVYYI